MQVSGGRRARWASSATLGAFLALLMTLVLVGCSGGVVLEPTEGPVLEARKVARAATVGQDVIALAEGNPSQIALESSQLFFESAQVVLLASSSERNAIARAASIAITLGAPLLLTAPEGKNLAGQDVTDPEHEPVGLSPQPGSLNTELLRLGTRAVLTVGEVSLHQLDTTSLVVKPVPDGDEELGALLGAEVTTVQSPPTSDAVKAIAELEIGNVYEASGLGPSPVPYGTVPETLPAERNDETIVLAGTTTDYFAGVATARAAGAKVFVDPEPSTQSDVVAYISAHTTHPVVGIGEAFQARAPFVRSVKALRAGTLLPSGAQRVFRADGVDLTIVTVDARVALKERGVDTAADVIAEAERFAREISRTWGVPTIAGIDLDPTADPADLAYWVSQTADADQYLLLRLPAAGGGYATVHTYGEALRHPHVGVRLEIEEEAGSAQATEFAAALTGFTQGEGLPQKLLVIEVDPKMSGSDVEDGPVSTDPVATVYDFLDGRNAQWGEARDVLAPQTTWGVRVTKAKPKEKGETAQYPESEKIMGRDDVSLVTFR